jgi:hypothetical protein
MCRMELFRDNRRQRPRPTGLERYIHIDDETLWQIVREADGRVVRVRGEEVEPVLDDEGEEIVSPLAMLSRVRVPDRHFQPQLGARQRRHSQQSSSRDSPA